MLNGFPVSNWCNDLPFRYEESQKKATYHQAYSDGMCTMFVSFGVELTRREGSMAASYCLPGDVKYLSIAQEFGLLLRRDAGARDTDPLDALIKLLEADFPATPSDPHAPTRAGCSGSPGTSTRTLKMLPQFSLGPPREPVTM